MQLGQRAREAFLHLVSESVLHWGLGGGGGTEQYVTETPTGRSRHRALEKPSEGPVDTAT